MEAAHRRELRPRNPRLRSSAGGGLQRGYFEADSTASRVPTLLKARRVTVRGVDARGEGELLIFWARNTRHGPGAPGNDTARR